MYKDWLRKIMKACWSFAGLENILKVMTQLARGAFNAVEKKSLIWLHDMESGASINAKGKCSFLLQTTIDGRCKN